MIAAAALLVWLFGGCVKGSGDGELQNASPDTEVTPGQEPNSGPSHSGDPANEDQQYATLAFPAQPPSPAAVVKLPVLMFHHIGEAPPGADEIRAGLTVSAADFENMMAYLDQAGYQPVSQAQLFRALFEGKPLPPQAVMLTFDDGYLDNYETAAPILKKYGFPATVNVITDKMGNPEYMSWEQVAELDAGGIDIGSHTCSHPDLTTLSGADLRHELADSSGAISSHLGHPVYWLCYPAGKYDADVIRYAREAGYLLAVTTEPGEQQSSEAPYALMRYRVRSDTGVEGFKELVR